MFSRTFKCMPTVPTTSNRVVIEELIYRFLSFANKCARFLKRRNSYRMEQDISFVSCVLPYYYERNQFFKVVPRSLYVFKMELHIHISVTKL